MAFFHIHVGGSMSGNKWHHYENYTISLSRSVDEMLLVEGFL